MLHELLQALSLPHLRQVAPMVERTDLRIVINQFE